MAKQTVNNGDTGLSSRTKINDNFTELYDAIPQLVASGSGGVTIETNNGTGSLKVNDGANEQMGLATLSGGTVTVNNSKVTANSRIFLSIQNISGAPGFMAIGARTPGVSFEIRSSNPSDVATVAWIIMEPN